MKNLVETLQQIGPGLLEQVGDRIRVVRTGTLLTPVRKPHLTTATAGLLPQQLSDLEAPLVVTQHATPGVCRTLRELDIPFVDAAGNAWLDLEGCFILIEGRTPQVPAGRPRPSRLFQRAGMRLVFVLLNDPGAVTRPYRELAELAGISLGSVSHVMEDLSRDGYVWTRGEKRLVQREQLLMSWCERYREALRDRARQERYHAARPFDSAVLPADRACWSGEVAAAELLGGFMPGRWTVFRFAPVPDLIAKWRLQPAADGEVEVIDAFWPHKGGTPMAPPVVIYADLVTSGNSRAVELAERLRTRYLTYLERA